MSGQLFNFTGRLRESNTRSPTTSIRDAFARDTRYRRVLYRWSCVRPLHGRPLNAVVVSIFVDFARNAIRGCALLHQSASVGHTRLYCLIICGPRNFQPQTKRPLSSMTLLYCTIMCGMIYTARLYYIIMRVPKQNVSRSDRYNTAISHHDVRPTSSAAESSPANKNSARILHTTLLGATLRDDSTRS